jgi:putative salt-induced outer membrane protein YdiY
MSDTLNPLTLSATTSMRSKSQEEGTEWFEAMAEAWGKTLDAKAAQIEALSDQIGAGDNSPSSITKLQAHSLEMSFLSQSGHSSISSVGTALETMARKQ